MLTTQAYLFSEPVGFTGTLPKQILPPTSPQPVTLATYAASSLDHFEKIKKISPPITFTIRSGKVFEFPLGKLDLNKLIQLLRSNNDTLRLGELTQLKEVFLSEDFRPTDSEISLITEAIHSYLTKKIINPLTTGKLLPDNLKKAFPAINKIKERKVIELNEEGTSLSLNDIQWDNSGKTQISYNVLLVAPFPTPNSVSSLLKLNLYAMEHLGIEHSVIEKVEQQLATLRQEHPLVAWFDRVFLKKSLATKLLEVYEPLVNKIPKTIKPSDLENFVMQNMTQKIGAKPMIKGSLAYNFLTPQEMSNILAYFGLYEKVMENRKTFQTTLEASVESALNAILLSVEGEPSPLTARQVTPTIKVGFTTNVVFEEYILNM